MKFRTVTEPDAIALCLAERVEEHNARFSDLRKHLGLVECSSEALRLRVRDGAGEGDKLDFFAVLSRTEDGYTLINGALVPANGEARRASSALYGFFVSLLARLTLLAALYGALLGISLLARGKSLLLPLIPVVLLALIWIARAVCVRLSLPRRISDFFCTQLACTELA